MVAAVVEHGLQVHQRVSRQRTFVKGLGYALLHRRNVFAGHPAADDFRAELEPLVPVPWLQSQQDVAVLTVPARLLLVPVLGVGGTRDCLPVGYPGQFDPEVRAELAPDFVQRYVDLGVARPVIRVSLVLALRDICRLGSSSMIRPRAMDILSRSALDAGDTATR